MTRVILTSTFLLILIGLTSCEGSRSSNGIVYDAQTGEPLDSVKVNVLSAEKIYYTDSTGAFEVRNNLGPCTFGCEDIVIQYSKEGYQTRTLVNEDSDGDIYLYH